MIESKGKLIVQISSHGAMCYMHGPIYGHKKLALIKWHSTWPMILSLMKFAHYPSGQNSKR